MSPVPKDVSGSHLFEDDKNFRASGSCGGARHGIEEVNSSSRVFFERFAFGSSKVEREEGLLVPTVESFCRSSSTCTSSWSTLVDPLRRRHGSPGLSRTTIIAPAVPAHRIKVGFWETQAPHTKLSYSSPEIRGGGRPEDEASEAASSPVSLPVECSAIGWACWASGLFSREVGLSRRLQHDSWNQS